MRIARPAFGIRSAGSSHLVLSAVKDTWAKLLGGRHPWGSCDFVLYRTGVRRYRLTLLRPDTGVSDRRLLRLWRGWPLAGGTLWLLSLVWLSITLRTPATALTIATLRYLVAGAALFVPTIPARAHLRSMSVVVGNGFARFQDPCREDMRAVWEKLTSVMLAATHMARRGTISPVEYEAVWWEVYRLLGAAAGE